MPRPGNTSARPQPSTNLGYSRRMSSYFGEVPIGEAVKGTFNDLRADGVVGMATYVGIAPEVTTVLYAPGDKFGLISAMASSVPIGICVASLTVFLCRRTAQDLWVGGGQIGCEIVNGILKLLVKQPRPSSPVTNMPVDSYGMPSAHSQYMGYFAYVICLQTWRAKGSSPLHRAVRSFGVLISSMFTAYSRYYLYYHSGPQVIIGYLVGWVFGAIWSHLADVLRSYGIMKWGLSLWPCRLLLIKDEDYSVLTEYQRWVESNKRRQR